MKTPTDEIVKALRMAEAIRLAAGERSVDPLLDAAADRLEELEGRALPELPEGWVLWYLQEEKDHWDCKLIGRLDRRSLYGNGPTPRAAVQAALDKMKENG